MTRLRRFAAVVCKLLNLLVRRLCGGSLRRFAAVPGKSLKLQDAAVVRRWGAVPPILPTRVRAR